MSFTQGINSVNSLFLDGNLNGTKHFAMGDTRKVTEDKSDSQLWAEFVSGKSQAFRAIYDSHIQSLFQFGSHFTKNDELIRDCIHDVFLDLYKYRPNLKATNNIKLYLFVALRRKLFRILSEKGRFISLDEEGPSFSYYLSSSAENEAESELLTLKIDWLEKAMLKLSNRQREAIYLRFVKGMSYEELSEILQMNYQSARNLIFRSIEKLRENCKKESLYLLFFFRKS